MFKSFAVVALAVFATVVKAQDCARNYTVHLGDFCDKISAEQGVSTYQLALVNKDTINADCSNLAVGMPLCLGLVGEDCTDVHVVVSGDDCTAIAAAAGSDFNTIIENNKNVNDTCSNIYPGEVLCVAKEVIPYTE